MMIDPKTLDFETIEKELAAFEAEERKRLGIEEEESRHWHDPNPQRFTKDQRDSTTILIGGLTVAHDQIFSAAVQGLGYKLQALDVPDLEALRLGKEFGNRGQCNPTYFTAGNLVKHLMHLRDVEGMRTEDIISNYLFFTAGACGPCRFGTYATEYRKVLADSGFDGFRVLLFQQQGGMKQATGDASGLEFNTSFYKAMITALMAGDVINLVGYRIRPYEVTKGETDRVLEECKAIVCEAARNRSSLITALLRCRWRLNKIAVNRLLPKPKVSIIGEFWAMTTEGDGNYRLQRFLEAEGAEVDIQPVTAWILYQLWELQYDTARRLPMRGEDGGNFGLQGKNGAARLALFKAASTAVRAIFGLFTRAIGLQDYHLADMDQIATISHQYYDNHLRGGEGHMEVGKLMQTVEHRKAHMVISVKPFGCMPSSGVSDGVQSLITSRFPEAIFTAIETTGDGEVNVQSRIQMDLFKAKKRAEAEYETAVARTGLTSTAIATKARRKARALHHPPHVVAGTAANQVLELAGIRQWSA
jgi:predicted nucleotide-binding protein (sugar kinase/HSP70/actin superfamily)